MFIRRWFARELSKKIHRLFGFWPGNLFLYEQALQIKNNQAKRFGYTINNERLEFLGDSILGIIVSYYLFKRFPAATEGELTVMKNRLVNRQTLDWIGEKIELASLLHFPQDQKTAHHMLGNTLEAFLGAIFIDKGYKFTENFILKKIFTSIPVDEIIFQENNYKSKLIEWCQKNKHSYLFRLIDISAEKGRKVFTVEVLINDIPYEKGMDYTIKGAQQKAAKQTLEKLFLAEHYSSSNTIAS